MVCPRFTHVVAGNVFQMLYGAADAAGRTYLAVLTAFFLPGNALFVLRGALEGIGRTVYTLASGLAELAARLVAVAILPPLLGWLGVCLALAAKDGGHGGWKTAAPAAIGDVDLAALGLA